MKSILGSTDKDHDAGIREFVTMYNKETNKPTVLQMLMVKLGNKDLC